MKTILSSCRLLLALTALTGLVYPLAVWAVGQSFFRQAAEGSLIIKEGRLRGSSLLAQKTEAGKYFKPRPSSGDFATVASGASNLTWTSAKLASAIAERRAAWGGGAVPADLLTTSGGGLDPDLSPEAVRWQAATVAAARKLTETERHALDELIARSTIGGKMAPQRINVLLLNLTLDDTFPAR